MPVLSDIVEFLGCELRGGDPQTSIEGVATLEAARVSELSFFTNSRYLRQAQSASASAILVNEASAEKLKGQVLLVTENPHRDFAKVTTRWFYEPRLLRAGIHPTAIISDKAMIHKSARIGAFVVIEENAILGSGCSIFPHTYIGASVEIGEEGLVYPACKIMDGVKIGKRVVLQPGVVLACDGFGFAPDPPHGFVKVPQRGGLVIGDDVEIQANTCVDRGALDDTRIENGVKIDNLVHIAHNNIIGSHTVLAGQVGMAGSNRIGQWVQMGGQSALSGHLNVGDQAIVTGQSAAAKDVSAGQVVSGSPARPAMENQRAMAELNKIVQLKSKVKELEARLKKLEERE